MATAQALMRKEIKKKLILDDDQLSRLENHSILNIINILIGEIEASGIMGNHESSANILLDKAFHFRDGFLNRKATASFLKFITGFRQETEVFYSKLLSGNGESSDTYEFLLESRANTLQVTDILEVRLRELMGRGNPSHSWQKIHIDHLLGNFRDVLSAIARNSKGRYNIVENIARKRQPDYLVNLKIESVDGDTITIPPVLEDCLRDLIANSRKYTPPGGTIDAGIFDDGKYITVSVHDTGCGIPEDELDKVVDFGFRSETVKDKRTMGGGFGLTKAYYFTKLFSGRMWIESETGKGTTITIKIPRPTAFG